MLLDATMVDTVTTVTDVATTQDVYSQDLEHTAEANLLIQSSGESTLEVHAPNTRNWQAEEVIDAAASSGKREIVFIDAALPGAEKLMANLPSGVEAFMIQANGDELGQIAQTLASMGGDVDAIHILSHGDQGEARIGQTILNSGNLSEFSDILREIGSSITDDGDILIYGCNVAETDGRLFVDNLASLTGRDVAASTDATGDEAYGGNWQLEYSTASIEATSLFQDSSASGLVGVLNDDVVDVNYQSINFNNVTRVSGSSNNAEGAIHLYSDVFSGVDALLTIVDIESNVTLDDYDNTATTGFAEGNSANFLSPRLNVGTSGRGVTYRIDFIEADSYNSSTKQGTAVTLGEVRAYTYDIDINQYQEFSTFTNATYKNGSDINVSYNSDSGLIQFRSTSSTNLQGNVRNNSSGAISVSYDFLSSIEFKLGGFSTGAAYFFIEFGTNGGIVHDVDITPDDVPGAPPVVPRAVLAADTGSSNSDRVTNNGQINVSNLVSGGTWEYSTNSGSSWTSGTGTSFTVGAGVYSNDQVRVRQTGSNGVTGDATSLTGFTVDTVNPDAPTIGLAADTGSSNSDGITKNNTINVSGLEANSTWEYSTNGGGSWTSGSGSSFTLAQGSYDSGDVRVRQTDLAGNTGNPASLGAVTIDTTAPSAPSAPDLIASSDTGDSDTDNVTADNTPTFSGTGGNPGDTVTLFANGVNVGSATVGGDGSWTITTSTLADGSYSMTARYTDTAGNESGLSPALNPVVINTSAPSAPTAPDLQAQSDTGSSDTDDYTSDNTPTFTGTGGTSGDTVTIYANGVAVGSATVAGNGSWSVTTSTLADGSYSITARYTNSLGNQSGDSPALNPVVIDTTAPGTPTVTAQTSNSSTPTVSGTVTLGANESLSVTIDGEVYTTGNGLTINGNTWSVTIPGGNALNDGTYEVTATVTDLADNTSTDASSNELVVDTTAPNQPAAPDLTDASDTGTSNSDNYTSDSTPSFSGGGGNPGDTATLYIDGVAAGTATVDGSGNWTITTGELTDDTYEVTVSFTDPAGNESAQSTALEVTIDTSAPTAPTVNSQTSTSATPTVTGTVTLGANETLSVTIDGNVYTVGNGLTVNGNNWSVTIPGADALSDRTYEVTATVTDLAGNTVNDSSSNELIVDATPPGTPAAPDLTDASDTAGASNTDNYTSDNTPTFTGSGGTPGDTATLYIDGVASGTVTIDGSGNWTITAGELADGVYDITVSFTDTSGNESAQSSALEVTIDTSAPAAPSATLNTDSGSAGNDSVTNNGQIDVGNLEAGATWEYTTNGGSNWTTGSGSSFTLTEATYGTNQVRVRQTDVAGNVSNETVLSSINVDQTDPPAPVLTLAADTGSDGNDGVTSNGQIVVTNLEGNSTWEYSTDGGQTWTAGSNTSFNLAEGSYANEAVQVRQTDLAGNTGPAAKLGALTIDSTAPAAPTVTSQTVTTSTPTVSGTVNLGSNENLSVTINGQVYTTDDNLTVNGNNWSVVIPGGHALSDGTYEITATVTDLAGNSRSDSSSNELVVDTTAPATPAAPDLTDASDTGPSNTDNYTSDNTPTFT
ncbi:MAG: hypothetical protein CMQ37_08875, partial [Gammaproteobacteria bacterium]|nr:hypothetical protein [Gammaproteobacteria bacterium]